MELHPCKTFFFFETKVGFSFVFLLCSSVEILCSWDKDVSCGVTSGGLVT